MLDSMNRTKIEYLDFTWNPCVGCSGIGCAVGRNCWAFHHAKRQKHRCDLCYDFVPHVHYERFEQPFKRKKPARIGVCFMGEFYDQEISGWIRVDLKLQMEKASWHKFLVLTKQPQNIDIHEPNPENLAIGVSVNRKADLWRVVQLRAVDVKLRVLSIEPLYEDLGPFNMKGIGWIIIGAQTNPTLQPEIPWVLDIAHQAELLGIPVFYKDNLEMYRLYPGKGRQKPISRYPEGWGEQSGTKTEQSQGT